MKRFAAFALVAVAGAALVACVPSFPVGGTATAASLDGVPVLRWTEAVISGEGESIGSYRIEIDGTLAATIAAPASACTLLNLPSSTPHTIKITVLSARGAGSQNLPANGVLTASITPTAYYGNGGSPTCVKDNDADGDGLKDAVETNTGTYASTSDTGTSPKKVDSDGDALTDREEVLGTAAALNLPAYGVNPNRKDILIEYDWFDDSLECGAHTHRPTEAAIARFRDAFAAAPVANRDGTTGINAVVDYGQGGAFTGGNLIADADGGLTAGVESAEYLAIKAPNFAANREGYFHYALGTHFYGGTGSSGQAELPGDDLIVSLGCYLGDDAQANTLMHELGHNLDLRHGGNTNRNYKPNYSSIMNYRYQFPGVDTTCDAVGDGVLDYSTGSRPTLDENALVEANGVCGSGPAIDWNLNGSIDASPIATDITSDFLRAVLTDFDDWSALNYGALKDADGASPNGLTDEPEIISEQPVPAS